MREATKQAANQRRAQKRKKTHRIKSAYTHHTMPCHAHIARIYTADIVEVESGSSIHLFVLFVRSARPFVRSFVHFTFSHHHHQHRTVSSFFCRFVVSLVPRAVSLFHSIRHLMVLFIARCAHIEIYTKLNVAIAAAAVAAVVLLLLFGLYFTLCSDDMTRCAVLCGAARYE